MNATAKTVGKGLGWFSIALGLTELLASRRIGKALGARDHTGAIQAFGAREIVAGLGLLQAPAHAPRVWSRVAGDAMDLGALHLLRKRDPGNKAVWGAIAFVAGAILIDVAAASALGPRKDADLGRVGPNRFSVKDWRAPAAEATPSAGLATA